MPGYSCTLRVRRLGEPVPGARVVFGESGMFEANPGGVVLVTVSSWPAGRDANVSIVVTDPRDGQSIFCSVMIPDNASVNIEMTYHGRYREPTEYVQPEE